MKFAEIIKAIETVAPLWAQAQWDKSGVQVSSSRDDFYRMAVCLDPTPNIIGNALACNADFILSHHPLSLKPDLPSKLDAYREALRLLLGANVALYAAHTSLDVNLGGPAGWFGQSLGLKNTEILELEHEPDALWPRGLGYGEIGDLAEPMGHKELFSKIFDLLRMSKMIGCGRWDGDRIKRVAYCGGSGASMTGLAVAKGAELFITGDVKYHAALDAEIKILDVGHHSLEEEMMRHFSQLLQDRLPALRVFFLPSASPFFFIGKSGK